MTKTKPTKPTTTKPTTKPPAWRWQPADSPFAILLEQDGPDDFRVTYGRQVREHLPYGAAAYELGAAILHALSLLDKIDNRTAAEADEDGGAR